MKVPGETRSWRRSLVEALDSLLFPWSCAICNEPVDSGPFCGKCRAELLEKSTRYARMACPRCGLRVGPHANLERGCGACRGRVIGFDGVVAFGSYEGPLRDLCLMLKHERNAWLARWLTELLAEARAESLAALPADACVAPIPLHWSRYWKRGYNQADALARELAKHLNRPYCNALRRVTATDKLTARTATDRREIMDNVFRIRPRARISGRTVLLVDDVLTTGATCGDAARTLRKAGAKQIVVVVLARTERARF